MAKVNFTSDLIRKFKCPEGRLQAFIWDSNAPGLGLRANPDSPKRPGSKAFIFQSKLNGRTLRITIGTPVIGGKGVWLIDAAQDKARRLQVMIDNGEDPRQVQADDLAAKQAERDASATRAQALILETRRKDMTLSEVWSVYVAARKSKWSAGHLQNHMTLTAIGGEQKKRGKGLTVAGPMAPLMAMSLAELTGETIAVWLAKESVERPTNAAQSYRLLRAFIRWAADIPEYKGIIGSDAYSARNVRDALPRNQTKEGDSLQREQLPDWFNAVHNVSNTVIKTYLQALLITGARREELAGLRWIEVDFQWRSLTIRDKVDGTRTIPLTPYLANLLSGLPRRNEWVFSSTTAADGKLTEPRIAHTKALAAAGLPHVSLHGLRRSFGTLCEWVEMPSGISAQIMGHRPSALAEKHYRRRPLDLLRKWHDVIESWILQQAGIDFAPAVPGLRIANS